ncbi:MAG: glycine--tRNA ligase subunit beta [Rhodospirillaceae bacterium]|nr:glycine--tRNA ligase subunit beta [Rhodospirillaceae bacterium]MBT5244854.1 glycine--tRNA ligase subunit beta [Rhodospirillaceae bacterium]MBT5562236.1 glycine--tRNA ligase subunit beta [Rhodospirillaceae bacterium]MBT6242409.1 glycine--tRNA ligase subunit beta [Rhodospirillaceae bacterium]MBT7138904.1 glycine--tRNA ligase subunit beta [Rhodospirillaceae bacterium]
MPELLLEILSEEIPARMQKRAAEDLQRLVCDGLQKAGLEYDSAAAFATPRRLTLVVTGLPEKTKAGKAEQKGPRIDSPVQAIEGFLRNVGRPNVEHEHIKIRETKKGEFYFFEAPTAPKQTSQELLSILTNALDSMSWPKSMRWKKDQTQTWVRPLHGILAIFDGETLPLDYDLIHTSEAVTNPSTETTIEATNSTIGHRFLSPESFTVKDFADYKAKLLDAKVMLDADERCTFIQKKVIKFAKDEGLTVRLDSGLLDEVAGLVEWPVVLMGKIDSEFMDVPFEVLNAAMRGHQKYFSCMDADGNPAAHFIFVSNMEADDGGAAIIAGNERVLRARLSDTKFFWDQDRKQGLESRLPKLAGVVFHAKLGSVLEKVERMTALAGALCAHIPGADVETVERAAKLCKADLVTGMVGELPELQGLMGQYYARETGEDESVAFAIAEHYSPAGPGDACPEAPTSVAVALADKIDTLVGFWAIDEKPTGSKDPFALRRAALGVIRLIIENNLRLSLSKVFAETVAEYMTQDNASVQAGMAADDDTVATAGLDAWHMPSLLAFFADRLKVHLKEKGVRHDLIDAVFALGEDDLVRVLARVDALGTFLETDDGANLLVAYKRAANIVRIEEKNDEGVEYREVRRELFEEDEEDTLWQNLHAVQDSFEVSLKEGLFTESMAGLAQLRPPIDAFFDKVTVNSDKPELRANRLALLRAIVVVMNQVADFSKIEG